MGAKGNLLNFKIFRYTSSRNSLEPSECGDESPNGQEPPSEFVNPAIGDSAGSRVSVISQQLEDQIGVNGIRRLPKTTTVPPTLPKRGGGGGGGNEQDSVSVSSTLSTLSGCSDAGSLDGSTTQSQQQRQGRLIANDNEFPDSGTGDSESEDVTPTISRQNLGKSRKVTVIFITKQKLSRLTELGREEGGGALFHHRSNLSLLGKEFFFVNQFGSFSPPSPAAPPCCHPPVQANFY